MVSVASAVVLTFFCFASISGQRKYSRTVPLAADVKSVVNFDCPEEFGYYPHTNDCTQYYVCVFGSALLESCTGGLMYSHELQTCDWPRNVGCDGLEISGSPSSSASSSHPSRGESRNKERDWGRDRDQPKERYPPPIPQPTPVVTSRGQPRQLQQSKKQIIKQQQQQQLYADAEEDLPPAEEVESDRQQRVYRGQPSTLGQVQKDRDGLRHSNAIPTYSGRGAKIGVISFGTQNQQYNKATDVNDIYIEDMTLQRRQKRQVYKSRQQERINTWHGNRPRTKNNLVRFNPPLLQKSENNNVFGINYPQDPFDESDDGFQPFVPDYQRPNSHQYFTTKPLLTKLQKNSSYPSFPLENNYSFFNLGSATLSNKNPEHIRHATEYNNENAVLVPPSTYRYIDLQPRPVNYFPQPSTFTRKNQKITEAVTTAYNEPDLVPGRFKVNFRKEGNKEGISEERMNHLAHRGELDDYNSFPEMFRSAYKYDHIQNPYQQGGSTNLVEPLSQAPISVTYKKIISNPYAQNHKDNLRGRLKTSKNSNNRHLDAIQFGSDSVISSHPQLKPIKYVNDNVQPKYPTNYSVGNSIQPTSAKYSDISETNTYGSKSTTQTTLAVPKYHISSITIKSSSTVSTRPTIKSKPIVNEYYEQRSTMRPFVDSAAKGLSNLVSKKNQRLNGSASFKDEDESRPISKNIPSSLAKSSLNKQSKMFQIKPEVEYEYYYDYDYEYPDTNKTNNSLPAKNYYYNYDDNYEQKNKSITNTRAEKLKEQTPFGKHIPRQQLNLATSPPTIYKVTNKFTDFHHDSSSETPYLSTSAHKSSQNLQQRRPSTRQTTTARISKAKSKSVQNRITTKPYDLDYTQGHIQDFQSDESNIAPVQPVVSTPTARTLYNSSQYKNNQYEPYYALYDDDADLYRDVEYAHDNYNNNAKRTKTISYTGTSAPAVQSTSVREDTHKRGNIVHLQNNYNQQDIYQQPTVVEDYNENRYDIQVDDQNVYKESSRQPSRGDINDLNDVEEVITQRTTTTRKPTTTTTRTTTTTTTTTTPTTTQRLFFFKKSTMSPASRKPISTSAKQTQAPEESKHTLDNTLSLPVNRNTPDIPRNRQDFNTNAPSTYKPKYLNLNSDKSSKVVVENPSEMFLSRVLITEQPASHYITMAPVLVEKVPSINKFNINDKTATVNDSTTTTFRTKIIIPTTYSPPRFISKLLLPKSVVHTSPVFSFRSANKSRSRIYSSEDNNINKAARPQSISLKTLKAIRKLINPVLVNNMLSISNNASHESSERNVSDTILENVSSSTGKVDYRYSSNSYDTFYNENVPLGKITSTLTTTTTETTTLTKMKFKTPNNTFTFNDINANINESFNSHDETAKLSNYIKLDLTNYTSNEKKSYTSIEVPPIHGSDSNRGIKQKPPKLFSKSFSTFTTETDEPRNTSFPTRVSRVNSAIKSLIAIGGVRRSNSKCNENQSSNSKCNGGPKPRTSSRGRGTAHYASTASQITNNEVTANSNRETPAPRARPTLKPSTSIVSKAQEFVDIYKYPPRRPGPIYPQPQPDKTAAKCRKDVCLLPDCNCGGKEIPGNIPVEETPQMVLITFDDAVNDLNKEYYVDLFEHGRVNPNGCPITATFYVSHEWTDYSQVQNLYADGHELASHTVSHSFGEQFSQKKWTREVAGQREILSAYGGVHLEDVRGMRAPFLSVGGNKMFKMLYDSNFTYDSSMPIYENKPPSWPYTLDYKLFHDCMIPPCPTRSYPGVWEVPMVMWQDLNGGRCSMGDACSNPPDADGVFKMLTKNFQRHYTTNRAPFGLFYHAAWFTQPHHKEGFINFIDSILAIKDVWLLTNWQAIQWVRDPTPISRLGSFQPFQCDFSDRPRKCNNPKVCNLWHKSGVRYMRTCQPCPDIYPWTGNTGIRSSKIDNNIED